MHLKHQKGLSLLWTAVVVGLAALAAMVALMSVRYERNYFSEAWTKLTRTGAAQVVQQAAPKTEAAPIRKCVIDGKTVYSNVECGKGNASSEQVQLHDTKGFEAPKVPVATVPVAEGAPGMRDKLIEQAANR